MNRAVDQLVRARHPVPRTRGDEPNIVFVGILDNNCSPHARG